MTPIEKFLLAQEISYTSGCILRLIYDHDKRNPMLKMNNLREAKRLIEAMIHDQLEKATIMADNPVARPSPHGPDTDATEAEVSMTSIVSRSLHFDDKY